MQNVRDKKTAKYVNNLGFKVSLSLIIVAIIPLIIYIITNNIVVSKNFSQLEKASIQKRVLMARNVLEARAFEIQKIAKDNSIWDDAYQKIQENDTEWFMSNYSSWLPENQDVDLVAVINREKEIIDQFGLDDINYEELFNIDVISNALGGHYDKKLDDYPFGLQIIKDEVYMVGMCPILRNDYSGPSQGIIFLGKKITPEYLLKIKNEYDYNILLEHDGRFIYRTDENSDVVNHVKELDKKNMSGVLFIEGSRAIGSIEITDELNKKIGYMYIVDSRQMFLSTLRTIFKNGLIILGISIIVIVLLSIKLRRIIVNPIKDFESQIKRLSENSALGFVKVKCSGEIASLANAYNRMISSLLKHKKENESLKILNITDTLTSLYNHGYFFEYFQKKVSEGCKSIALLFCDIDHFKMVNDVHGHVIGNAVLSEVGAIIKQTVGNNAAVFRYGGEEFVVLLENYTTEHVKNIAEMIRLKVGSSRKLQKDCCYSPITISIGIAFYPDDATSAVDLIDKADKAMYYAKHNGRNQCQIYNPSMNNELEKNCSEYIKQEMVMNSVYTLAAAIDAKDAYTEKHSESVTKYALQLAEKYNLSEKDKMTLQIGGILHDCGKIGVPDEIIHKQGPLSIEEWDVIKKHTLLGSNIIKFIIKTPDIEACIKYHHERWDGKGYPEGLAQESIPFYARIISIADAYHAMISDRPYRKAMSNEEAIEQLRQGKGTQFDPELVEDFIQTIEKAAFVDADSRNSA